MKWFGHEAWGPPCNGARVPIPVGETCIYCDEQFAADDHGGIILAMMGTVTMTAETEGDFNPVGEREYPIHAECWIRSLYGSVRHQRGECKGDGSCNHVDDGMTVRQDAALAASYFLQRVDVLQRVRAAGVN